MSILALIDKTPLVVRAIEYALSSKDWRVVQFRFEELRQFFDVKSYDYTCVKVARLAYGFGAAPSFILQEVHTLVANYAKANQEPTKTLSP